ncbi:MAG: DUF928 domain-containing protein [Symploca sp. SIO1C2]|nr:DUF928 domain-containing protein [Symploca sp. SIO1C2]
MNWHNNRFPLSLFALTVSLGVTIAPSLVAQTQPLTTSSNVSIKAPGSDSPVYTVGGGSRHGGVCAADKVAGEAFGFQVLMPAYSETSKDRPSFSLQVPQTVATKVFLSLRDANEDYYYQTTISLPKAPGQFNFSLPADAPVIETNKEYTWFVGLVCNQALEPNDPTIQGVIKRVDAQLNL